MPMTKGTVKEGAALKNSFRLEIPLLGTIHFIKASQQEQTLTTTTLADQTVQTTGKVEPVEVDLESYAHHETEINNLELWFAACKSGSPGHKQIGTFHIMGADGQPVRSYIWDGVILKGRTIPELDAGGDGEAVAYSWKMAVDNIIPL